MASSSVLLLWPLLTLSVASWYSLPFWLWHFFLGSSGALTDPSISLATSSSFFYSLSIDVLRVSILSRILFSFSPCSFLLLMPHPHSQLLLLFQGRWLLKIYFQFHFHSWLLTLNSRYLLESVPGCPTNPSNSVCPKWDSFSPNLFLSILSLLKVPVTQA